MRDTLVVSRKYATSIQISIGYVELMKFVLVMNTKLQASDKNQIKTGLNFFNMGGK